MPSKFNALVEGCMPDSVSELSYCELSLDVPDNARVLLSSHSLHADRFLLHASTEDFFDFSIVEEPRYELKAKPSQFLRGGIPLLDQVPNFRWIYDAQRSVITNDGRLFVNVRYFSEGFRFYLDRVPRIIERAGAYFCGECGVDGK